MTKYFFECTNDLQLTNTSEQKIKIQHLDETKMSTHLTVRQALKRWSNRKPTDERRCARSKTKQLNNCFCKSDARPAGWQSKREATLLTVIGLTTEHRKSVHRHIPVCVAHVPNSLHHNYIIKLQAIISNWASSWDYGTYRIGEQRRLRRDCSGETALLARAFAVRAHNVWK